MIDNIQIVNGDNIEISWEWKDSSNLEIYYKKSGRIGNKDGSEFCPNQILREKDDLFGKFSKPRFQQDHGIFTFTFIDENGEKAVVDALLGKKKSIFFRFEKHSLGTKLTFFSSLDDIPVGIILIKVNGIIYPLNKKIINKKTFLIPDVFDSTEIDIDFKEPYNQIYEIGERYE